MEFCFWEPFILGSVSGKGAGELGHGWMASGHLANGSWGSKSETKIQRLWRILDIYLP